MLIKPLIGHRIFIAALAILLSAHVGSAQTTAFTYQGQLNNGGSPATGSYDIQFKIFDALADGIQQGATITNPTVAVSGGVFTVELDFGAGVFDGTARYLEISVRPAGSVNPYTVLAPRQSISSTPYAMQSMKAAAADGLSAACVNCVTGSQIQSIDGAQITGPVAGSQISGTIPTESVPTGSGNYIQNSVAAARAGRPKVVQEGGFDITGDGSVGGNFVVGGQAGFGTAAPLAVFHVNGSSWFQGDTTPLPAAAGKGIVIGFSGEQGYISGFDYGTFTPKNLLLNLSGGNVGIGTTNPISKLTIQGGGYGLTHTAGSVVLGTFITTFGAGSAWVGTKSNHSLNFFTNDSPPQVTLSTAGNFGIGMTDPTTKLYVLSSVAGVSAIYGESGSGRAVWGKSTSSRGVFGESTTNVGVWGVSTQSTGVFGDSLSAAGVGGFFQNSAGGIALKVSGTGSVGVLQITGGSDLAEHFDVVDDAKPGMLVTIDPRNAGKLLIAHDAYDRRVAGVVSGANRLAAGMVLPDATGAKTSLPVALSGRVWVFCDARRHPITPGDLLTTSATPGHAMKVTNYTRAQGAIIGKAMTRLKGGRGLVLVLVSLQ